MARKQLTAQNMNGNAITNLPTTPSGANDAASKAYADTKEPALPAGGNSTHYLRGDKTWQTLPTGGSGDVVGPASATANSIAIFSGTTGKIIADGGKTLPSGALVGISDAQTLTNKTLTNPVISDIYVGANIALALRGTGTANYLAIYNNGAGLAPYLTAIGSDTNISINLVPKGTGLVYANSVQVADISSAQSLTNKNLSSGTNTFPTFNQNTTGTAAGITGKTTPSGALVGTTDVQTITNKNLTDSTNTVAFRRVIHGATAGTPRPNATHVEWVGSVAPTNANTTLDTWIDTA